MFCLYLNDMRSPKCEMTTAVAWSDDAADLEQLLERERVEGYRDDNWVKVFRKDGPLEWFNEPSQWHNQGVIPVGTLEERIARVTAMFDEFRRDTPHVSTVQPQAVGAD